MTTTGAGARAALKVGRVGRTYAFVFTLALGLSACGSVDNDQAGTAAGGGGGTACLEGATIEFVVPYDPGGGYDAYARLVGPYLEKETGATVVVRNQPGAGGLGAIAKLANATQPDGRTIAIMNGGAAVGGTLADSAAATSFNVQKLTYIARVATDPNVVVTSASGPYQSWADIVRASSIRFGSTGVNSSDYIGASVLSEAFGLNSEIVLGFEGSAENQRAVIRGDVDVMTGGLSSRLPAIESGQMTPVLAMSSEPLEALPDVPTVMEQDLSDRGRAIVEADLLRSDLSRVVVAPPGMPKDLTSCLRTAFKKVLTSEEAVVEGEKIGRPVNWLSGAKTAQKVEKLLRAPEPYVALLQESLGDE